VAPPTEFFIYLHTKKFGEQVIIGIVIITEHHNQKISKTKQKLEQNSDKNQRDLTERR
jgi:hypothetical protein